METELEISNERQYFIDFLLKTSLRREIFCSDNEEKGDVEIDRKTR